MREKTFKIISIGIAAAIVGGMVAMAAVSYPKESAEEFCFSNYGGMMMTAPEVAKEGSANIALSKFRISEDEYESYGIDTQAESAYTVTAKVTPNDSSPNSGIIWSLEWKNAGSAWATGKVVTDYVKATPSGTSVTQSKKVAVSCIQEFGEPINLIATSKFNPDVSKICVIDYVQKIYGVSLKFGDIECNLGGETAVRIDLGNDSKANGGVPEFTYELGSVYTVAVNPTVIYSLSDNGYMLLGTTYGIGSFSGGNFRGYHFFHMTESRTMEDRVHYYIVTKGLYFNYAFLRDSLGLRYSSYWQGQFMSRNEEKTVSQFQSSYDYPEETYNGMYNLFDLTVTVSSGSDTLYTNTTTFVMDGYKLAMTLSDSSLRF